MNEAGKRCQMFGSALLGLSIAAASMAESNDHSSAAVEPWVDIGTAIAIIHPTEVGKAQGLVRFESNEDGSVTVSADIEGLEPGSEHGFHVHEHGDCSHAKAESAGDHYNPQDHPHGLPEKDEQRHAGDLGNLSADQQGRAQLVRTVGNLTVAGNKNPVLGRSVIVHGEPDDGSQPSGDAGPRIGCGVVGVAAP